MSRRGRFGKYGELKRKSRLRASRISKLKRLRVRGVSVLRPKQRRKPHNLRVNRER